MQASVVDLRYQMRTVLQALARNEEVTILSRGKERGRIIPIRAATTGAVVDHPFFGMCRDAPETVAATVDRLRGPRY